MKKNNKGFMLVEVIVTSTIIVTAMIGLYTSFNKLYKNYNARNSYYNIDAVYATKAIFNDMLKSGELNKNINDIFQNSNYEYLIKNGSCTAFVDNDSCSKILEFYKVKNMIIVEYDKEIINTNLRNTFQNETFKEYTDYVVSYYDVTTNEEYSYLLLTEIYDGSNYYYANLRVR